MSIAYGHEHWGGNLGSIPKRGLAQEPAPSVLRRARWEQQSHLARGCFTKALRIVPEERDGTITKKARFRAARPLMPPLRPAPVNEVLHCPSSA